MQKELEDLMPSPGFPIHTDLSPGISSPSTALHSGPSLYPPASSYPPPEEYWLEQLVRDAKQHTSAKQAATQKTAVVIPYKHYTELFARKLEREGISYKVEAAIRPEAITEEYLRKNFIVYLSTAEPSFTFTFSLAELMKKDIIPHRNGKVVRIIPSVQAPLLMEALSGKNIPYCLAYPRSEKDPRKEYEVDLTRIVLE